jgi:hypothetical protein
VRLVGVAGIEREFRQWRGRKGMVGVIAGVIAGSIALIGFGLDSAVEGLASVIVVWRFTGTRTLSEQAEGRAQKLVAVSFFLLASYVAVQSLHALIVEHHAESCIVGIALTTGTFAICPGLGIAKQRIGDRLGSIATKGEVNRTSCVPGWRWACSVGCSPTPHWACGGSTPPSGS